MIPPAEAAHALGARPKSPQSSSKPHAALLAQTVAEVWPTASRAENGLVGQTSRSCHRARCSRDAAECCGSYERCCRDRRHSSLPPVVRNWVHTPPSAARARLQTGGLRTRHACRGPRLSRTHGSTARVVLVLLD